MSTAPRPLADPPATPSPQPQVDVTADFDKPSYITGDHVQVKVTVKNVGTVAAAFTANNLSGQGLLTDSGGMWGPLDQSGKGVQLQPGESASATIAGHQIDPEADTVRFVGYVMAGGVQIKDFAIPIPITKTVSHASGFVFGDKNHNGKADPGEELTGAKLTWSYRWGINGLPKYTATSDDTGHFSFPRIPTGTYQSSATAPDGWLIEFRQITLDPTGTDNLQFKGVKSIAGELTASVKFTQHTYQVGDLAHVTVTLANKSSHSLLGIVANCNRAGFGYELTGTGPGWGDLAGDGVNLASGETKVLDVTEAVPQAAFDVGHVFVACDFGFAGIDDPTGDPRDGDVASVPGGIGEVQGQITYDPEGHGPGKPRQPVADVRIVLTSDEHCPIVAETKSDANGAFAFTNLPVGPEYQLFLFPPAGWKVTFDNPTSIDVRVNGPASVSLNVEPGDATLPALPTQPADCAPPAVVSSVDVTPESHSGLASTGANVIGLTGFAVITLFLGAAAVVSSRRRRTAR